MEKTKYRIIKKTFECDSEARRRSCNGMGLFFKKWCGSVGFH